MVLKQNPQENSWFKIVDKLKEECEEAVDAVCYNNSYEAIAGEFLDVIQVCIRGLDKLETEYELDIQQAIYEHNMKLKLREWKPKAVIHLSVDKGDE